MMTTLPACAYLGSPLVRVGLIACLVAAWAGGAYGAEVKLAPLHWETELSRAVILTPEAEGYPALGRELAAAIQGRTGIEPEVRSAQDFVAGRPRAVKPDRLGQPFILLGQFWNNAVLERLYAGMFDPTDALFPGPGGYELRTVCSPFRAGQNCVVVTGSDLAGCRQAAAALPAALEQRDGQWVIPFLHEAHLTGEAGTTEAAYRQRAAAFVAEMDSYAVFGGGRRRRPGPARTRAISWSGTTGTWPRRRYSACGSGPLPTRRMPRPSNGSCSVAGPSCRGWSRATARGAPTSSSTAWMG